jgi:signal transduction histidine kinase/DNA-binding response OmpR family regulator
MHSAELPPNEDARLRALIDLGVLDSGPEEEFDALVRIASLVCEVPISLISLIDAERQWFKANIGLPGVNETPRDIAFCAHAILSDGIFEVPDATQDTRFFDNPLVASQPDIRFYAGAPIFMADGYRIGTLCVIDRKPRKMNSMQREILSSLALAASQALEGRRAIRAQKDLARDLTASEERLMLATEVAGIGIWDFNLISGELKWDAQNYLLYGLKPSNSAGAYELWSRAVHADDLAAAEQSLQHTIATGQDFFSEFRVIWPDGSIHKIKGLGRVRKDDEGKSVRIVGTNMDVTEAANYAESLKLARDNAEKASQSKGQFLANMSHEIRTPMNAILGMLNLLGATELNSRQVDYAGKAEAAAKSLLGLLNDILDFSKIEAGKLELDAQPFSLERLLRDLSVIVSSNLGKKPVEILFDLDPTIPTQLVGDSMRLQQVLINLSGNAVKFTERGEIVIQVKVVDLAAESATLRIAVKDSGIGISPDNQKKLFSDFIQAEASTTRRFGGTGLGLSICKRLVNLMGGDLLVDSVMGQGSTFHFEIQLPISGDASVSESKTPHENLKPMQVLVVDDNAMARDLIAAMAKSLGWTVDVAQGGVEALSLVRNQGNDYQAIFMDWDMPDMDGWETIERIRSALAGKSSPITVMVTASGREALSQRSAQEQAQLNAFLVKPITASMLREVVSDAREGRSNLRAKPRNGDSATRRLNGMRVLVVEDNRINQQVARELLLAEGALVEIADNGLLGVSAVTKADSEKPFDAVLMDLQMPVMDGFEATRVIRQDLGLTDLPIVAMTANAMASDREACLNAGMNDHVGKPFDLNHLISVLLKVSGYRVVENPKEVEDRDDPLTPPSSPLNDHGIDVDGALARMSGMRTLYTRLVGDFLKALDGAAPGI